jgi:hypothetical protein
MSKSAESKKGVCNNSTALIQRLCALKREGLTFSDCVRMFGVSTGRSAIAQAAKLSYEEEGSIEVGGTTVLSRGQEGVYVMAWLFVPKSQRRGKRR